MTTLAQALPRRRSLGLGWIRRYVLTVYAALALVYLFLPIAIVVLFSFNNPAGRFNYTWQGFTFKNWTHPFNYPGLQSALTVSIEIALLSSLVATIFGTLIALALVRYHFRGSGTTETVMFMNIAAPEIVLGAALLSFFVLLHFPMGLLSIFVAHVMFNIAFVAIVVRARLSGFHREIEEAAQDLYANAWVTFYKVTLPLIWPGILAGGLLAFALSIDDFVTTNFVAGQTVTFPLWVYGAVKVGIPPQVFVMGTSIFLAGLVIAIINVIAARRRNEVRQATEDSSA
jgi:spermidine/putrescine transport system permease protein